MPLQSGASLKRLAPPPIPTSPTRTALFEHAASDDTLPTAASDRHAAPPLRASVITLAFNRPDALQRCLRSLVAQSVPKAEFEVVVVDVSTPTIDRVLDEFRHTLQLVHLVTVNGGVAANRNAGAAHARGHVIVFLDDDCRATPRWLEHLVAAVERDPTVLAGAPVVHEVPDTAVAAAGQVITDVVHDFFNRAHPEPRFLPGLNFAVRRTAYHALGGCDDSYGRLAAEDRDFNDRWRAAGGAFVLCEDAAVHHDHRSTLGGFVRQYVNYGRGAWRYHSGRRKRGTGPMTAELRLHAQLPRLLRAPLRRLPWAVRMQTVVLLGVWQIANAAGFVYQAVQDTIHGSTNASPR